MSLADQLRRLAPRIALHHAYQGVFGTPEGRMVLHDLLREGGMLKTSHVLNDPADTAFREGKRAMALHLVGRLRWSESELLALAQQRTTDQLETGED